MSLKSFLETHLAQEKDPGLRGLLDRALSNLAKLPVEVAATFESCRPSCPGALRDLALRIQRVKNKMEDEQREAENALRPVVVPAKPAPRRHPFALLSRPEQPPRKPPGGGAGAGGEPAM